MQLLNRNDLIRCDYSEHYPVCYLPFTGVSERRLTEVRAEAIGSKYNKDICVWSKMTGDHIIRN